jgi:hypothetical protein
MRGGCVAVARAKYAAGGGSGDCRMKGWPAAVFVIFSVFWGIFLIAILGYAYLWELITYMIEESPLKVVAINFAIVGIGGAIWYGAYRLMRKVSSR